MGKVIEKETGGNIIMSTFCDCCASSQQWPELQGRWLMPNACMNMRRCVHKAQEKNQVFFFFLIFQSIVFLAVSVAAGLFDKVKAFSDIAVNLLPVHLTCKLWTRDYSFTIMC